MESGGGEQSGGRRCEQRAPPNDVEKTGVDTPISDELRELWMASACKGAQGEEFGGRARVDGVLTREDFDSGSAEHVLGRGREKIYWSEISDRIQVYKSIDSSSLSFTARLE